MFKSILVTSAIALSLSAIPALAAAPVTVVQKTVNGLVVDQYKWIDSKGRPRTVSLKKEGLGNPGHGGYAVQMTYQYPVNSKWRTMTVNADKGSDGGFGYFVSHERYRHFSDGSDDTIAGKIFGQDDSPLGLGFAVTDIKPASASPEIKLQQYKLKYPRYGTAAASPLVDGNDVGLPLDKASFKLHQLPVTITWVFQTGKDYPLIRNDIDLTPVGSADHVSFDVRGPYGVMEFAGPTAPEVSRLKWGDRFHFETTAAPVTLNSPWTWNVANTGARYHSIATTKFEMGMFEPKTWAKSALRDGYSEVRGMTSAAVGPIDCGGPTKQALPCAWEWPYQSLQYSLDPNSPDASTNFKKFAWGSTSFYGTGNSVPTVFDSPTTSSPFKGFPKGKHIKYDVCLVLGVTTATGLTKTAATSPALNCAKAQF